MPNILDAIQVSGASYDLKDKNAPSVSSLTQSEYDNLPSTAKTSNTFFVITDAQGGDLSNYWTTAQTQSAITQATSGLQETLVSGTNIKTINNTSILGSGNIDIQGGGGSSYTAGTGIDITNNVISVTGMVDTTTYTAYTAATDSTLANKQTTLTAGTNITIVDNVISATGGGGGGVNVVQTTGTSTTDVMSQDAVTTQLNGKADKTTAARGLGYGNKNTHSLIYLTNQNGQEISGYYYTLSLSRINGKVIATQGDSNPNTFSLVETSAITTSITSSSTDAQVPSAKAVYDIVGDIETLLSQI